ncbi:MAG: sporulation protein YunB [Clostridia bacterium]|nr:sporulation protein YunB [Clostridia bacterium]MDD4386175.1 sporulation protein YunB [Clostridia bacterium]
MRLKYYKRTLRQMHINKPFVFILISIVFILIILIFMYNKAVPIITAVCESNAKYIALDVTNKAVSECINDIKYEDLVSLKQDETGKITAINSDVIELNKLSTDISTKISYKLANIDARYVKIPLTSIFNIGLFSGYGPKLALSIVPTGYVSSKYKSEFEQAGINQIRHRIYIEITTKVRLIAPFYTSTQEYVNEVTVAENVIIGDTPATYYNINGMENKETFEVIN